MPYGTKTDADGKAFDFEQVYRDVIEEPIKALGLNYVRSDHVEHAGSIRKDMFARISSADVAIVDITTLNANVFYELGVRHALKPSVTVVIRRRGASIPFNIEDLRVIDYPSADGGYQEARERIRRFIENGLKSGEPDSPIDGALLKMTAEERRRRLVKLESRAYRLRAQPGKAIQVLTGDIQERRDIDVWVSSENTNMQMARFYDRGMSAMIRYLGARKDDYQNILEDTIANELAAVTRGRESVPPGTVYPTGAGALAQTHGVKKIFHAAAVVGTPGEGYLAIPDIDRCVTGALRLADTEAMRQEHLRSIAFPLMGTGTAAGELRTIARRLIQAAISYLCTNPHSTIETVSFLAWNQNDLDACLHALGASEEVELVATPRG